MASGKRKLPELENKKSFIRISLADRERDEKDTSFAAGGIFVKDKKKNGHGQFVQLAASIAMASISPISSSSGFAMSMT